MKLQELYEFPEVKWEDNICEAQIGEFTVVLTERAGKMSVLSKVAKDAKSLMSNPWVAGMTALWAADALKKYKRNKMYTTQFYAKTPQEKKLYDSIVKDLMKTGNYRLIRTKMVDGGKLWELKRNG